MDDALNFITGPLFSFSFAVFILGSLRLGAISIIDISRSMKNTMDRSIPWKELVRETMSWMLPYGKILQTRRLYSVLSFVFHATLLTAIVFNQDHILLVRKTLGVKWPHIGILAVDVISLLCIASICLIIFTRLSSRTGRSLTDGMDFLILGTILITLLTGFIASKSFNPLSHGHMLLVHSVCGNAILVMIPFSRLGHWVVYPILWIATAIAWKLPVGTTSEAGKTEIG